MENDVEEIIALSKTTKKSDQELIRKAYQFAKTAHKGQKRNSGNISR